MLPLKPDMASLAVGSNNFPARVYENPPDDLRTERKKMNAVLAANAARSIQLEVSLIGQGGRLQCVTGGAAHQVLPCDSPYLRVDARHQVAQSSFIAVIPGNEQSGDIRWTILSQQ